MFDFCFYATVIILIYLISQIFIKFIKKETIHIGPFTSLLLLSFIQFLTMNSVQENEYSMYYASMFLTILFFFSVDSFLYLFKFRKVLIIIFSSVIYLFEVFQRYIVLFKGIPFTIDDISAARTALSVAGNYNYTPTFGMIKGLILLIVTIGFTNYVISKEYRFKELLIYAFSSIFLFSGILVSFNVDRINVEKIGSVNFYEPMGTLSDYGSLLNLYINYIYSTFDLPADYEPEKMIEEIESMPEDTSNLEPKAVNVICILDESFYDLSLIRDIDTDIDYLKNFHEIDENTVKGYTVVSAFGGGTANSEYEFLTNGNMLFLPRSSYPFTKFIKNETSSIVSRLKDLGFSTIAYHSYERNSWNRETVYPLLGFDKYYGFLDRYNDHSIDYILRGILSDEGDFQELINIYNEKAPDEKLFLYNVTIQNHSGYANYPEVQYVVDKTYNDQAVNTFLSLIKRSDESIKELFDYFDNVDEPTLICVFGDHIPGTLLDIVEEDNPDTLDKLNYYRTPFMIHTNYDINEEYYENISLSYLSTLVMDYANLPKSKEQTFVQSFMDKYPIINKFTYGTSDSLSINRDNLPDDLKLWRDLSFSKLTSDY